MSYQRTVVSLMDTYAYVRDTYRDIAVAALLNHTEKRPASFKTVVFDPAPFLVKLVEDINLGDNRPKRFGGGADQTIQLLVDAGMPGDTARWIYHQCWSQVTDAVASVLPEASTGPESDWSCELSMGLDLVLSRWVELPATRELSSTEMQVEYPALAMIAQGGDLAVGFGNAAVPTAVPGTRLSADHSWLIEEPLAPQITSRDIDAKFSVEYGRGT